MRRWILVAAVGIISYAGVYAVAASLSVTTSKIAAGGSAVAACSSSASITYNVSYSASIPGYKVTTAPITSAVGCASKSYKVTLMDGSNVSLGEMTGTLDGTGAASPDFSSSNVSAASVANVQLVITG